VCKKIIFLIRFIIATIICFTMDEPLLTNYSQTFHKEKFITQAFRIVYFLDTTLRIVISVL